MSAGEYARWVVQGSPNILTTEDVVVGALWAPEYWDSLGKLFAQMGAEKKAQREKNQIFIAGWVVDAQHELDGNALVDLLPEVAKTGVRVRVLLNGGGPKQISDLNRKTRVALLAKSVLLEVLIDEQHQANGSHHQKAVYASANGGTEHSFYCGGIDLAGDGRSQWLDVQAIVQGNGARLGLNALEERWASVKRTAFTPLSPLPYGKGKTAGKTTVQFARTYGKPNPKDPANPRRYVTSGGDFGIHQVLAHAIRQASNFIYIEDQYVVGCRDPSGTALKGLASLEDLLGEQLAKKKDLNLVVLTNRSEEVDAEAWRPFTRRRRLIDSLGTKPEIRARVHFLVYRSDKVTPPFIHSKVWIFDDQLAVLGSANYCRSGLSNESELAVAIASDEALVATTKTGKYAKVYARQVRIALWLRALNRGDSSKDFELADVEEFGNGMNALLGKTKKRSPFVLYDDKGKTDSGGYWGDPDGS